MIIANTWSKRLALQPFFFFLFFDITRHFDPLFLKRMNLQEGLPLHIGSSIVAGLCASLATAPFDLVKTRIMRSPGLYTSSFHCASFFLSFYCFSFFVSLSFICFLVVYSFPSYQNQLKGVTIQHEGVLAMWKGFFAQWIRIGPHTLTSFIVLEQLRRLIGLEAVGV